MRLSASQGHLLLQDAPRDPYLRALAPLVSRLDPAACRVQAQAYGKTSLPWVDRNGRQGNPFPACRCRPVLPESTPGHQPFAQTEQYQKVLSAAHEHLLNSIEDERIDIDSWAPDTIARWVQVQTVGFIQEWRIPINEEEMQVVADGLVKELTGFGPLDDLLHDPSIEDILINGFKDVHVSQGGQLKRATQRFTDDTHLLHPATYPGPARAPPG